LAGAGVAITISSENVSLDLGGFTIRGNDAIGSYGIHVTGPPHYDITIANRVVRDFQFGLDTGNAWRSVIECVHASSNIRGFHLGNTTVLTACTARENADFGIYVPGTDSRVQDCAVVGNLNDGIAVQGSRNLIELNHALLNGLSGGEDIRDAGVVQNTQNTFRENVVTNLVLKSSGGAIVVDNVCYGAIQNPAGNLVAEPDHLNTGC
jgi:hypothetical protein